MSISKIDIYRYDLIFNRPVIALGQTLLHRSGLLIKIYDEEGKYGIGEIAPFPGLSRETLEKSREQVLHAWHLVKGIELQPGPMEIFLSNLSSHLYNLYPSVLFGFEMALLNLMNQRNGKLFYQLYGHTLKINKLLFGSSMQILKNAQKAVNFGYRAVKIKVGSQTLEEDINTVHKVRSIIGHQMSIRLDANRSWNLEQACEFGLECKKCDIEYIEEPLQNPAYSADFYAKTGIPVALDESLQNPDIRTAPPKGVKTFIIKPGIWGGIFETIQLIKKTEQKDITNILSCPFYSAFGLETLARLSLLCNPATVMGLDTFSMFKHDFLKKPIKIENGLLDIKALWKNLTFDLNFTKKLEF